MACRTARKSAPLLALALGLGASAPGHAQSLFALYQAAQGYDASFQSARQLADATLARGAQAQAGVLPSVSVGAGVSQTSQGSSLVAYDARNFTSQYATITATQPLYRPGNWSSYAQGDKQTELAQVQLLAAQQDLMLRVSQTYFDVLAATDSLEFVRSQKAAVAEQLASAQRNFDVGTANIVDTRDAQARFDLVQAQELAADNDLRVKSLALDQLVGSTATVTRSPHIPLLDTAQDDTPLQGWIDQSQQRNPQVRQMQLALDVAQLETSKASAVNRPTLDLVGSYTATNNIDGSMLLPQTYTLNQTTIGVVFSLPLYAGGAIQGRVHETLALENKAQADLQATQRDVAQATRSAYYGLQTARAQVRAYEAAEKSSQSALEANQLGYQVGVKINIDVLNAQSQLYDTKARLSQARYSALLGELKLRQASGTLQESDIENITVQLQP